jgi:hypothetical protein
MAAVTSLSGVVSSIGYLPVILNVEPAYAVKSTDKLAAGHFIFSTKLESLLYVFDIQ